LDTLIFCPIGKKIPRINNKINRPIPAPGSTAIAIPGGVGVNVGVTVGVLVGVLVAVDVAVAVGVVVEVAVAVEVGVMVNVALGGMFVGRGVFLAGSLVDGHTIGSPVAGSTHVLCAFTDEGEFRSRARRPTPNMTKNT
jgi:hypothetical protein